MTPKWFWEVIRKLCRQAGRSPTNATIDYYWEVLKNYDEDVVRMAIDEIMYQNKGVIPKRECVLAVVQAYDIFAPQRDDEPEYNLPDNNPYQELAVKWKSGEGPNESHEKFKQLNDLLSGSFANKTIANPRKKLK